MESEAQETSLLQDLWNRRFFQYLGTYLGLSFGLLQFMDFLVNRYQLDSSLVDKTFIFLAVLIPAVATFIYNHGRPGHDRWNRFERFFIPASLVIGLTLAVVLFNDSAAQAATEKISIATLSGGQETRVVPKVEFTKRFAIFPFEDRTKNSESKWLGVGLAYLLDKDLEQFMMNYAIPALSMRTQYEALNAEFLQRLPFSSELKIAQEYYTDYFISGAVSENDGTLSLAAKVYNSQNGQLFYETEVKGADIFDLVDQLSTALESHLYLKDNLKTLEFVDLPASNLVTSNPEALQELVEGLILAKQDVRSMGQAVAKVEKATQLDPNCATCFASLAELYFGISDEAKMKDASGKAVVLADGLPERQRLLINYYDYNVRNQWDRAELLLNNWCQLYPHDYTPFSLLMTYYLSRQLWGKAEEVGQDAFAKGHRGSLLYSLATIYISKGEFDEAQKYIDQYYELYPHQAKDKSLLEKIYSGKGELEKAKELYENELVMTPGNVEILVKLGRLEDQLGNLQSGLGYLDEALQRSRNTQDSVQVYQGLETHYERMGQFQRSFELNAKREQLMQKFVPASQLKQQMFFGQAFKLAINQKEDTYFALLEDLKKELPQNSGLFDCLGNYLYFLWTEESESFEKYSTQCLQSVILPMYGKEFADIDQGARAEISGDYPKAIQHYKSYVEKAGVGDIRMAYSLATVYRKNGELENALERIDEVLKLDPNEPVSLMEKARILYAKGEKAKAKKLYEQVMAIWQDADESYEYYQEALKFGQEIAGNS